MTRLPSRRHRRWNAILAVLCDLRDGLFGVPSHP